ncbi:MAG: TIGR00341 family protein, partial [Campylobacteraceae bacterium 4484_4]
IVDVDTFWGMRDLKPEDRAILCMRVGQIKRMIAKAEREGFAVMLYATKKQNALRKVYRTPKTPREAIALLLEAEPKAHDLLYLNEKEIILYGALVGEAPPLGYTSASFKESDFMARLRLFMDAMRKLRRLKLSRVKLKTAKEQEIVTAATGVVVIDQENGTCAANLLPEASWNDGRLSALILSPASVFSYLHYLLVALFPFFKQSSLPDSVGLVETQQLQIESDAPLPVMIDGHKDGQTPATFSIHPKAVRLCASEAYWKSAPPAAAEKETLKIEHLPQSDEAVSYMQQHIPLFTHASESEYKELFVALRSEAKTSPAFIVMMILSTILATVGLFLNSASVIIGAMLLAPLMQPIVSFAMGALRGDQGLLLSGIKSVATGVALVLLSAAIIARMLPFSEITPEMAGRLHPSLLDLIVAVVSGIAAAYAKSNPKISGSLVGVAIAVALVPPLSTAGIGLGWMRPEMFTHAFLLFLTNFVGIVLAAGLIFMILGYSPIRRAKKGLIASFIIAVLVSIPLFFSFSQMASDAKILSALEGSYFDLAGERVRLEQVKIKHGAKEIISCDLVVRHHLTAKQIEQLKSMIYDRIGEEVVLESVERIRF